jgi:HlyD family secretion protein
MLRWMSLLLLGGMAVSAGCQRSTSTTSTPNPTAATAEAPVVTTATPKKQPLNWIVEQPGTVQPYEMAPLVAKLPGYVLEVRHDLGDQVPAGEVLATISIPELEQEANQKRAMVGLAEAEVEQSAQSIRVAEEQINSALALVSEAEFAVAKARADRERWDSEVKRFDQLASRQVIDQQTLEETRKQAQSAKASFEEAQAKVLSAKAMARESTAKKGRAEADLKASHSRVKSAEAEVKRIEAMLSYREIRAPFAGVVTGRFVHAGHFLQPSSGSKAEPLFTFARVDKVRVFVDVPEAASAYVDVGTPAVVRVPGMSNQEWNSKVTRTAQVLNPDTRTLKIEIDLDKQSHPKIPRAGLFAYVRVAVAIPDAMVVPSASVLYADETAYVYVVQDGKALKYRVQVGRTDAKGIQLIAMRRATVNSGEFQPITGSTNLVVGNLGALTDGQPVSVKQ